MVWNVWTVSICVLGVKLVSATVRHDAAAWPVAVAHELQRARAAGSSLPHDHVGEEKGTGAGAAADDVALDLVGLTDWYRTRPHVRDAAAVARAAQRRGLSAEEAAEIREWLSQRTRSNRSEPDAKQLSDAELEWMTRRG